MASPILPRNLPAASSVAADGAFIVDTGAAVQKATPAQIVDSAIPLASQGEAEAGVNNVKRMTPLRVKQAIDALGVSLSRLASTNPGDGSSLSSMEDGATVQEAIAVAATAVDLIAGDSAPDEGAIVRTADGFVYAVAPSGAIDNNLVNAAGTKFYVLPNADGSVSLRAFGAHPDNAANVNKVAIDRALASGFLYLTDGGIFKTTGGHVIRDQHISGGATRSLFFEHEAMTPLSATYSQSGTTSLTVTMPSADHGIVPGQSIYLDFTSGSGTDYLYTVASVAGATVVVQALSATTSGNVTVHPGAVCFKLQQDSSNSSSMGCGMSAVRIENDDASENRVGFMVQNYTHARCEDIEVVDYNLAGCIGFLWENYNNNWCETGIYQRLRAANCRRSYVIRKNEQAEGTHSFAYNRIQGTVSSMPALGTGVHIEAGCSLYGSHTDFNIYMNAAATATGFHLEGTLADGTSRITGEMPGSTSDHTAIKLASTANLRDTDVWWVLENGLIDIDVSAVVVTCKGMIASLGSGTSPPVAPVRLLLNAAPAAFARANTNISLSAATWTDIAPLSGTFTYQRPVGSSYLNLTTGVYTASVTGLYRITSTATFTPTASGETGALRVVGPDYNVVLDRGESGAATSMVLNGSCEIYMDAGETVKVQAYSTAGDTLAPFDSDGHATRVSFELMTSR